MIMPTIKKSSSVFQSGEANTKQVIQRQNTKATFESELALWRNESLATYQLNDKEKINHLPDEFSSSLASETSSGILFTSPSFTSEPKTRETSGE